MLILPLNESYLHFKHPQETYHVRGWDPLLRLLTQLTTRSQNPAWLGGWISYPHARRGPEAYLEVHHHDPQPHPGPNSMGQDSKLWLSPLIPKWNQCAYQTAFERVQEVLRMGESYQINLTFPLVTTLLLRPWLSKHSQPSQWDWEGLLEELWRAVGSQSKRVQGSLIVPPRQVQNRCPRALLSWSPEAWIRARPLGVSRWEFESRPMKGTALRSANLAEDLENGLRLHRSPKTRAENLMITDMVRHEFSQLVQPGRVEVLRLFEVEPLNTLWQMTSTVWAMGIFNAHPLPEIIAKLFPPASITGAPKRRTMEWIQRIEKWERGIYTGVTFLVTPWGEMESSVAIRSLQVNLKTAQALFGVGGGVLIDSTVQEEYHEALSKAFFLKSRVADFDLLETLRWEPQGGFRNLEHHLRRLARSAAALRRPWRRYEVVRELKKAVAGGSRGLRVRLTLSPGGEVRVEAEPLVEFDLPLLLTPAKKPIQGSELLRRFKTSRREVYEKFKPAPGQETLLWDEEGYVLEGTFTNLAFFIEGTWLTPSLTRPLLGGVMREILLQQGRLKEANIKLEDALSAPKAACFNSLRGWMDAAWSPT